MEKIVIFSGAGMSAESGLRTFRDSDGLWEEYDVHDVATPEAWARDPALVLKFYNLRRQQVLKADPNEGHKALVDLEAAYDVQIITQNIDDLHERAGSKKVLHIHGDVLKARSIRESSKLYPIRGDLNIGDKCENGHQLRPHVVWFGEPVPALDEAIKMIGTADRVIIIGTSLNVYPAASIINFARPGTPFVLVDPGDVDGSSIENLKVIRANATNGVPMIVEQLLRKPEIV